LLEQVSGRAGRGNQPGEVIVQTDFPDHAVFEALERHDFDRFAETLLAERETLGLPPFAHLALLSAEAKQVSAVNAFLAQATLHGRALALEQAAGCEVYAAVPAALARRAGLERGQVLAQSRDRRALQEFLPRWRMALEQLGERSVRWSLDVDPLGFA
jgi:primosomal protein N' (replication factor Y) (superfamily II helicase)